MLIEIRMPRLRPEMTSGMLASWLKQEGERFEKGEALFEVETDKVVCYCKFCTDGINTGGKQGLHLIELLFPTETAK